MTKLNNSGSLSCKKYIGIALKIKKTDQINIPELIQNKKSSIILSSLIFFSLNKYQDIDKNINNVGRLIIGVKFIFCESSN